MNKIFRNLILSMALSVIVMPTIIDTLNGAVPQQAKVPVAGPVNFDVNVKYNYYAIGALVDDSIGNFSKTVNDAISQNPAPHQLLRNLLALFAMCIAKSQFEKAGFLLTKDVIRNGNITKLYIQEKFEHLFYHFLQDAEGIDVASRNKLEWLKTNVPNNIPGITIDNLKIVLSDLMYEIGDVSENKKTIIRTLFGLAVDFPFSQIGNFVGAQFILAYETDASLSLNTCYDFVSSVKTRECNNCEELNDRPDIVHVIRTFNEGRYRQATGIVQPAEDALTYTDNVGFNWNENEGIMNFMSNNYYQYAAKKYQAQLASVPFNDVDSVLQRFTTMINTCKAEFVSDLEKTKATAALQQMQRLKYDPDVIGEINLRYAKIALAILGDDHSNWKKWIKLFADAAWSHSDDHALKQMATNPLPWKTLLEANIEANNNIGVQIGNERDRCNKAIADQQLILIIDPISMENTPLTTANLSNHLRAFSQPLFNNAKKPLLSAGISAACGTGWQGFLLSSLKDSDPGVEFYADKMLDYGGIELKSVRILTHNIFVGLIGNDKRQTDIGSSNNKALIRDTLRKEVNDKIAAYNSSHPGHEVVLNTEANQYLETRIDLILQIIYPSAQ